MYASTKRMLHTYGCDRRWTSRTRRSTSPDPEKVWFHGDASQRAAWYLARWVGTGWTPTRRRRTREGSPRAQNRAALHQIPRSSEKDEEKKKG